MRFRIGALAVAIGLASSSAGAAPTQSPWSVGVSEAKIAEAKKLLDQGNELFIQTRYTEALATFLQAVAAWDHPAIRFNIVRCLIALDRPVEAEENLTLALKYGAAPLEERVYSEALAYQKLLAKQIGEIKVDCDQPGVALALDGHPLGTCPTKIAQRLLPGRHQISGTHGGLVPQLTDLFVVGGDTVHTSVHLEASRGISGRTIGKATLYAGGGLLVVSGGIALYAWRHYRGQFPDHCMDSPIGGAPLCDSHGASELDRSRLFGDVATVAGGVGAAAMIVGAVILFHHPAESPRAVLAPSASGATMMLQGTF